jgi:hypothetical protein
MTLKGGDMIYYEKKKSAIFKKLKRRHELRYLLDFIGEELNKEVEEWPVDAPSNSHWSAYHLSRGYDQLNQILKETQ